MARRDYEPRWPPCIALIAILIVVALLPARVTLVPNWLRLGIGGLALLPMIAVPLTHGNRRSLAIERATHFAFCGVVTLLTLIALAQLVYMMVRKSSELSGLALLSSSIAVWAVNVFNSSILYWQLDRGGPEARLHDLAVRPDWLFPQDEGPRVAIPPNWRPTFVDYLYLAYTTATAFSTTDVAPLTSRSKLLMMLESSMSLMVIVVVGARAINILGA